MRIKIPLNESISLLLPVEEEASQFDSSGERQYITLLPPPSPDLHVPV